MGGGQSNLIILFLLISSIASSLAQNTDTLSDPTGESLYYFEQAGLYLEQNQLDSSIYYLQLGLPYYRQRASWINYINCYNGLSSCHYEKADYTTSLHYTEQALAEAESRIGKDNSAYTSLLNNLAHFAWERRHFSQALNYLTEALNIEEELGNTGEIITILYNMGLYTLGKGDLGEGLRYYNRALRLSKSHFGPLDRRIANGYTKIARAYLKQKKWEKAKEYFLQGINILEKQVNPNNGATATKRLYAHLYLAQVFLETQQDDSLHHHIELAENLAENHLQRPSAWAKNILADWQKKNQKYDRALQTLNASLEITQNKYRRFNFLPRIGETYRRMADVTLAQKQFTQSLHYSQEALRHFSNGYPLQMHDNPPIDSLVIDENLLLILNTKARSLLARYQKDAQTTDLEAAKNTYKLALSAIARLRQSFLARASKEELAQTVLPIYEGAIECLYIEYQQNPNPQLLEAAFQLAESNKAILLLEALNENSAKSNAGIPDSLLQQDQRWRSEIAFLEQKKAELQNKGKHHTAQISLIDQQLFELKEGQQELIRHFEQQYPRYYQLKFDTQLSSIAELQQKSLRPDGALLEYFVGEQDIYLFTIQAGDSHWQRFPKPSHFNTDINQIRLFLQELPRPQKLADDFQEYHQIAYRLYQTLIEPASLPQSIKSLTIIPDDLLGYLPFEVLLRQAPDSTRIDFSPQNLTYLLNDFAITYSYSASLLYQNQQAPRSNTTRHNFIGFAPQFSAPANIANNLRSCNAEALQALQCNEQEVEVIRDLLGGEIYRGEQANKENFEKEVAQYRILHLATHACIEDQQPMLNKIFFSDESLANYELFNLDLQAELAVLSACNTGMGTLLRGEGVMSLARGFFHAGCPSTLISLWSVEDCTTTKIMEMYYQDLKAGKTKDEALRAAKVNYLATADRLRSHPFYWAPFVQFGDPVAMDLQASAWRWEYGWGILLVLVGVLYYFWFLGKGRE